MHRIALYSTQPVLATGLRVALADALGLHLAMVTTTIPQLLDHIRAVPTSLVLVELTPEVTLDVLKTIQSEGQGVRVVLWVDSISTEFASQVIGMGVRGILRKRLSIDLQLKCLQKVAEGELWLEKSLTEQLITTNRVTLTRRERQLIGLLAQGLKNKEIARALGITDGTVKVYLSHLFRKVGANDRFDLALFALRNLVGATPVESIPQPTGLPPAAPMFVPCFMSRAAFPDIRAS
jgi:two-component system, NarL family, nitrate/nitrite response regulator NarL